MTILQHLRFQDLKVQELSGFEGHMTYPVDVRFLIITGRPHSLRGEIIGSTTTTNNCLLLSISPLFLCNITMKNVASEKAMLFKSSFSLMWLWIKFQAMRCKWKHVGLQRSFKWQVLTWDIDIKAGALAASVPWSRMCP